MNQNKVLFNSILFNQVPAAEALNCKKQKFVIKKLNSLNNLFLTKTSNYPEIIEKAKLIKRSIELGLKLFELESNTKNQKVCNLIKLLENFSIFRTKFSRTEKFDIAQNR